MLVEVALQLHFGRPLTQYFLHIDSTSEGCEYGPIAGPRVDYFVGYYGHGLSSEFRCSLSSSGSLTHRGQKNFFFTSCGSLIPFTRANAQWVFHGLHIAL